MRRNSVTPASFNRNVEGDAVITTPAFSAAADIENICYHSPSAGAIGKNTSIVIVYGGVT